MRIVIIIFSTILLTSCLGIEEERAYQKRALELQSKTLELEYLERLYQVRSDIEFEEKRRTIDSLILEQQQIIDKLP